MSIFHFPVTQRLGEKAIFLGGLYKFEFRKQNRPDQIVLIGPVSISGAPGRIRTCYPRIRSPILYPDELQALITAASIPYPASGRKCFLRILPLLLSGRGLEEIDPVFAGFHLRPGYNIDGRLVPGLKIGKFLPLFVEQIIGHLKRQPAFNPVDFLA